MSHSSHHTARVGGGTSPFFAWFSGPFCAGGCTGGTLTLHGGSSPRGSQASSLMSCLFQGCCLAPEGGAPAYWTLTPARWGVGSSKQPPLVAEHTPSKTRYCFYPWERLTTEPANSLRLVRCKMSDRTIPAHASGTGNAGRTCG